jgi:hypothetical protein
MLLRKQQLLLLLDRQTTRIHDTSVFTEDADRRAIVRLRS